MRNFKMIRWAGVLVAFVLMPLSACNELLDVENPEEVPLDNLDDAALLDVQVAGVRALLAESFAGEEEGIVQGPNFLTDETITGLNWEDWARVNQRIVRYFEGPVDPTWSNLSELIRNGQTALGWFDELAPDPATDPRVALVAALTGYGFVFIGETMCQAVFSTPDELGTTVHTPPEVFPMAIPFFEQAITVGSAAGDDDVVNLARVGLARAYLNLADFANAVTYGSAVPSGFEWWIEYSDQREELYNNLYDEVHGDLHTIGVHPNFLQGPFDADILDTQTDPRIQHSSEWSTGHNGSTHLYKPYQGLRYSGYTGETLAPPSVSCPGCTGGTEGNGDNGDVLLYQRDTDVLLADRLEAQHHMYEAMMRQGGNDAAVEAFVNQRRAVGNETPVTGLSSAALFAELRRQRSRDFYMGGFRLGDLRRWLRDGVGDFFPTGPHPNPTFANYGPWTCLPLPLEEYEGNPNIQRPANPDLPPGI